MSFARIVINFRPLSSVTITASKGVLAAPFMLSATISRADSTAAARASFGPGTSMPISSLATILLALRKLMKNFGMSASRRAEGAAALFVPARLGYFEKYHLPDYV